MNYSICLSFKNNTFPQYNKPLKKNKVEEKSGFRIDDNTEVCLVLGGGAAKGVFEVGVMEALRRSGIKPDIVVGNSIGAGTAAILSDMTEKSVKNGEQYWRKGTISHILGENPLKNISGNFLPWQGRNSILAPSKRAETLRNLINDPFAEKSPKLIMTATDIIDGERILHVTKGLEKELSEEGIFGDKYKIDPIENIDDLLEAVKASSAFPIAFPLVKTKRGRIEVDGGMPFNRITPTRVGLDALIASVKSHPVEEDNTKSAKKGLLITVPIYQKPVIKGKGYKDLGLADVFNQFFAVANYEGAKSEIPGVKKFIEMGNWISKLQKEKGYKELSAKNPYGQPMDVKFVEIEPPESFDLLPTNFDSARKNADSYFSMGYEATLNALKKYGILNNEKYLALMKENPYNKASSPYNNFPSLSTESALIYSNFIKKRVSA